MSGDMVSLAAVLAIIEAMPDGLSKWRRRLAEGIEALTAQSAPVDGLSQAARDVLAERQRQISAEGWTPEHDDQHRNGAMAMAASCYAMAASATSITRSVNDGIPPRGWPWLASWWRPTEPRRDLVKAGALILAEIERLDRAAEVAGEGGDA